MRVEHKHTMPEGLQVLVQLELRRDNVPPYGPVWVHFDTLAVFKRTPPATEWAEVTDNEEWGRLADAATQDAPIERLGEGGLEEAHDHEQQKVLDYYRGKG